MFVNASRFDRSHNFSASRIRKSYSKNKFYTTIISLTYCLIPISNENTFIEEYFGNILLKVFVQNEYEDSEMQKECENKYLL